MSRPGQSPDPGITISPSGEDLGTTREFVGIGHPLERRGTAAPIESLYIHVPFCTHKCHYCDFYSFVDTRDQQTAFVDRLIEELATIGPHAGRLRTIFVGGGTPSLLRLDLWERVLGALNVYFDLSEMPAGEFTVECNPETTTAALCGLLRAGGVNRISIGAQSFEHRHLRVLERLHNPENVARAIEFARAAGVARQSVDLIFGIPGQTLPEWERDIDRAIGLGTSHVSCYALTYEPNTAMTKRLEHGEFARIDEDVEVDMFALTLEKMRGAGMARYEVSNFARPGHESRHNLAYWRQEQWLSAGPSASGHALAGASMREGSWRWKNVPRLGDYLATTGHAPVTDVEMPDPARLVRERIMMSLRLEEGLNSAEVLGDLRAISEPSHDRLLTGIERAVQRGHLRHANDRWRLTDAGFLHCDGIAGELMRCVVSA